MVPLFIIVSTLNSTLDNSDRFFVSYHLMCISQQSFYHIFMVGSHGDYHYHMMRSLKIYRKIMMIFFFNFLLTVTWESIVFLTFVIEVIQNIIFAVIPIMW